MRLRACSHVDANVEPYASDRSPAYELVRRRSDLVWLSYALLGDDVVVWPKGLAPVLYPGPVYPEAGFALMPGSVPGPLARMVPQDMVRGRAPCCRELAAFIFVGYPRGTWDADSATALRLEPLP